MMAAGGQSSSPSPPSPSSSSSPFVVADTSSTSSMMQETFSEPSSSSAAQRKKRLQKKIRSLGDLEEWKESATAAAFLGFVQRLGESVRQRKLCDQCFVSDTVQKMVAVLSLLEGWVAEIPAEENRSRFGNAAFRTWHDRLSERAEELMKELLCTKAREEETVAEIVGYFTSCFGDYQRIDYGTGHEAHFAAWLYCFEKVGLINDKDYPALVLRVFNAYMQVMRRLQLTYWLEPAGSHGVWGLDDYHFLPFLLGAAQLADHKYLTPNAINQKELVFDFSKDYLYFACIQFINQVKTESLQWHSPMLYDISSAKSWAKVYRGMVKMYKAEVLAKLPIMQHFLFGTLLPFQPSSSSHHQEKEHDDHVHHEHATCCISHLPSAVGAKALREDSLRPLIPFD